MIDTLRSHRQHFDWELEDNCLANCAELVENIGSATASVRPGLPSVEECVNLDESVLNDLFWQSPWTLGEHYHGFR